MAINIPPHRIRPPPAAAPILSQQRSCFLRFFMNDLPPAHYFVNNLFDTISSLLIARVGTKTDVPVIFATAVLHHLKTRRWSLPPLRREYSMLLRLRPHVLVCWGLLTLDIGKICKQLGPAYCSIPSNYLSLYPSIITTSWKYTGCTHECWICLTLSSGSLELTFKNLIVKRKGIKSTRMHKRIGLVLFNNPVNAFSYF